MRGERRKIVLFFLYFDERERKRCCMYVWMVVVFRKTIPLLSNYALHSKACVCCASSVFERIVSHLYFLVVMMVCIMASTWHLEEVIDG